MESLYTGRDMVKEDFGWKIDINMKAIGIVVKFKDMEF